MYRDAIHLKEQSIIFSLKAFAALKNDDTSLDMMT